MRRETGTCTIRIQCTHRTQVTWGLMLTLATVLIDGDGGARPGCVNHFGKGGVAALGVSSSPPPFFPSPLFFPFPFHSTITPTFLKCFHPFSFTCPTLSQRPQNLLNQLIRDHRRRRRPALARNRAGGRGRARQRGWVGAAAEGGE